MEPNNRTTRPSRPDYHFEISSPVLRLLQVNDRGMVFESRTSFEIGDAIELGFHITSPPEGENSGPRVPAQEFITGQGMVVGCRFCSSGEGLPVYEVTLLFSAISERDKTELHRISEMGHPGALPVSQKKNSPARALLELN